MGISINELSQAIRNVNATISHKITRSMQKVQRKAKQVHKKVKKKLKKSLRYLSLVLDAPLTGMPSRSLGALLISSGNIIDIVHPAPRRRPVSRYSYRVRQLILFLHGHQDARMPYTGNPNCYPSVQNLLHTRNESTEGIPYEKKHNLTTQHIRILDGTQAFIKEMLSILANPFLGRISSEGALRAIFDFITRSYTITEELQIASDEFYANKSICKKTDSIDKEEVEYMVEKTMQPLGDTVFSLSRRKSLEDAYLLLHKTVIEFLMHRRNKGVKSKRRVFFYLAIVKYIVETSNSKLSEVKDHPTIIIERLHRVDAHSYLHSVPIQKRILEKRNRGRRAQSTTDKPTEYYGPYLHNRPIHSSDNTEQSKEEKEEEQCESEVFTKFEE